VLVEGIEQGHLSLTERRDDAVSDELQWLEKWYATQCNGTWEHQHGILVQSLDNPGWLVKIDLNGTNIEKFASDQILRTTGVPPTAANQNLGGPIWMLCEIRDRKFNGAGDQSKLRDILDCFQNWVCKLAP
jgi:hypothetical protein